jgi:hypothetical protein
MEWTTPDFVEIKMDAEISAYQEDGDVPPGRPDPVQPSPPRTDRSLASLGID